MLVRACERGGRGIGSALIGDFSMAFMVPLWTAFPYAHDRRRSTGELEANDTGALIHVSTRGTAR